jgi:hypothetical protein
MDWHGDCSLYGLEHKGGSHTMNNAFLQETTTKTVNVILHDVLTFIYYIAHQIGVGIIKVIQSIFPSVVFPGNLIDPLGFLVILTVFMIIVTVAKKVAWIIIGAGWILLFIRILMIIFKIG